MQRQRFDEEDRFRGSADGTPGGDGLNEQRREIAAMQQGSDRMMDRIDALLSQGYIEQNRQTGAE